LSAVQPRHTWNEGSQIGAPPEQSASARHPTQVPDVAWQTGVDPLHAAVLPSEHWPQAPLVWQAGVAPPQSASPAQARQACVVVLHTGAVPPHCAFDVHGTQTAPPTSQAGVAAEHCEALLAEHWPQAPLVWQAGVAPPQSPSPPQARHVCEVPSQTGAVPLHCAFDVHVTQVPLGVWQSGVVPRQRVELVPEHWPQAPPGWQAGVVPPHSASPAQARHVWVVVLHTGLLPPHCASDRHGTQEPIVVRQTGVAPPHFVTLVAEHWAQAPLGWQAGVVPGHSLSAPQARQAWVVVLQTGVAPPHWAFEVQGTQVALAVSQAGVAPVHWLALVAEHWAQAPLD
jgi:hypothetical protein